MEGLSATKKAGTINTQQQSTMAEKIEELSVVTYNCRGLSASSLHDIEQLCAMYHNFSPRNLAAKLAATIKTAAISQNLLCDNKTKHEKNMNWNKATQQQKLKYQQASKICHMGLKNTLI